MTKTKSVESQVILSINVLVIEGNDDRIPNIHKNPNKKAKLTIRLLVQQKNLL